MSDESRASKIERDTLEKTIERTRHQAERRMLHKEVAHMLIQKFVTSYMEGAQPNSPGITDPQERSDLMKGRREKWAILRAAEHYQRDERTIREIINPSARTRRRRSSRG